MIIVVTVKGDLHAHAVQHAARGLGYDAIHLVESDQLSGRAALTWRSWTRSGHVTTSEGQQVDPTTAAVVWWRRANSNQEAARGLADDHERAVVDNDCRGALLGLLQSRFTGSWVSSPAATSRASDKIVQLEFAARAGFRVPRTLVTQSKAEVLQFSSEMDRTIVKPVVGAAGPLMFTQYGDTLQELPEASFEACPAIYQEYIPGTRHVRLNVFGSEMYAALIETDDLDWRANLNTAISRWTVPDDLRRLTSEVLADLGLRMGVVDIKLTEDDEPVWLEVNPQGQFLFLEPLIHEPLAERFAAFLVREADSVEARRRNRPSRLTESPASGHVSENRSDLAYL